MRFLTMGVNVLIQLDHVVTIVGLQTGGTEWTLVGGVKLIAPDISLEQAKKAIKESVEL